MLSVGGRPVIDWVLEMVAQSGVREVLMNLHHCAEILTEYCGDGARWGVTLTYAYEPTLLGTAGGGRDFGPLVGGGDPVFVLFRGHHLQSRSLPPAGVLRA